MDTMFRPKIGPYDSETTGAVIRLTDRGKEFPTLITVAYSVNGKTYSITECVSVKDRKIKIGFLTVGHRKTAMLGDPALGDSLDVLYASRDPADAIIKNNQEP